MGWRIVARGNGTAMRGFCHSGHLKGTAAMERQLLVAATLVAALAGTTGALADCAEELAHLTEDDTGQSEEMDGGTFATMGQKAPALTQSSDTGAAQAGSGGDAGRAIERLRSNAPRPPSTPATRQPALRPSKRRRQCQGRGAAAMVFT